MGVEGELEQRRQYSEELLEQFRSALATIEEHVNCAVVVTGSLARREASKTSDVDYFILHDGSGACCDTAKVVADVVKKTIDGLGLRDPASGGAFAEVESIENCLRNVGGNDDANQKFTRRMLFMLEGEWLWNEGLFKTFRNRLIDEVYVKADLADHQLARFFLNDVIRYWRTIGVDYEFKTSEGNKPWGPRNLKLAFSRKLLYFSGLLMVAETAQKTRSEKVATLSRLCELSPTDRIREICGPHAQKTLSIYEVFLAKLSDGQFRELADTVKAETPRHEWPADFRDLKNLGRAFSWELDRLLALTYGQGHPIHHAVVF